MGLTIKMRIDEHPEHTYVYSTGDDGHIELIPLSVVANGHYAPDDGYGYSYVDVDVPEPVIETLNITENGTYTAEGKVWNVVTVDVAPLLESVTKYYDTNGTYSFTPSAGKDGISDVTVTVDVPQALPNLESIVDTITANGQYTYTAGVGYDGIDSVDLDVNVSGGSGGNVVVGLFTPVDGASQSFNTGRTGIVRALYLWPVDKSAVDDVAVQYILRAYSAVNTGTGNGSYFWKLSTLRSGTSGSTLASNGYYQVMSANAIGTAPSNVVGISSDGGTIYYRGKASAGTTSYGFTPQAQYNYMVVYD